MALFDTEQTKQHESIDDLSHITKQYFKNWSVVRFFGAEGPIEDVLRRNIIEAERRAQKNGWLKDNAKQLGLSQIGYETRCQEYIEKFAKRARCFKNVYASSLDDVLNGSQRFKTQFETRDSSGIYNPDYRTQREHASFGFPNDPNHKPDKRPTYGYLSDNEHGVVAAEGECKTGVSQYGNITIKMRAATAQKTTFMSHMVDSGYAVPSPMLKPHFMSLFHYMENPLDTTSPEAKKRYFEAQYHGGMGVDDIESVHVRRSCMTPEEYDRVKKSFSTYAASGGRSIALVEY